MTIKEIINEYIFSKKSEEPSNNFKVGDKVVYGKLGTAIVTKIEDSTVFADLEEPKPIRSIGDDKHTVYFDRTFIRSVRAPYCEFEKAKECLK